MDLWHASDTSTCIPTSYANVHPYAHKYTFSHKFVSNVIVSIILGSYTVIGI